MSELSRTTSTPVATIKYYQREGLLPPGLRTSPNQAQYSDEHVRRIHLIRALLGPGRLDVATARAVIGAIDSDAPLPRVFATAQRAASVRIDDHDVDAGALDRVDDLLADFAITAENPGRAAAAAVIRAFEAVGQRDADDWYRRYAEAALLVAEADLDMLEQRPSRDEKAETVVVGSVLGDALFAALRRAAQEHVSTIRYEPGRADAIRRTRSSR